MVGTYLYLGDPTLHPHQNAGYHHTPSRCFPQSLQVRIFHSHFITNSSFKVIVTFAALLYAFDGTSLNVQRESAP
jgi:hypothetical protein